LLAQPLPGRRQERSVLHAFWKKALFIQAFRHYIETVGMQAPLPLQENGCPRDKLRKVYSIIADQVSGDPDRRGCLMVNTITDTGERDPELMEITSDAQEGLRKLFEYCLGELAERGQTSTAEKRS